MSWIEAIEDNEEEPKAIIGYEDDLYEIYERIKLDNSIASSIDFGATFQTWGRFVVYWDKVSKHFQTLLPSTYEECSYDILGDPIPGIPTGFHFNIEYEFYDKDDGYVSDSHRWNVSFIDSSSNFINTITYQRDEE